MNHLLAYYGSAVAAGTIDYDIPGLTDQCITLQNNHYILPNDSLLLHAYAFGASVIRAKINTPKMRSVALPYINPVERSATPPDLPAMPRYKHQGPVLAKTDETAILISNNLGSSTEIEVVGLWVELPGPAAANGTTYTIRATGTTTVAAGVWTLCPLTMDYTLPYGRYAVTGMSVVAANGAFGRLQLPGYAFRPGCIVRPTIQIDDWSFFRMGNMGSFGEFDSTAQPQLELLTVGANSAQEVYLDVIKIR